MGAPQWVMLIVAGLTAAGVLGTLWQRQRSEQIDRSINSEHASRTEWWRRFEWAAEQSLQRDDAKQVFGLQIMDALTVSPLVTSSERDILRVVAAARRKRDNGSKSKGVKR